MNRLFKYVSFIAAAAMAVVSCTKEIENNEMVTPSGKMKTITVRTSIDTKTTLDANHNGIVWSSGDEISIFNNIDNANFQLPYSPDDDFMIVEVPEETEEIYAHYPYYDGNSSGPTDVSVYISANQTQKNPGELDGYYYPMVAKGTVTSDNKALVKFYPVASALALNIYKTGLVDGEEETVSSVKVTPSSVNSGFIGKQMTDITGDNVMYSSTESTSESIVVNISNPLTLGKTKPDNKQTFAGQIYVCLAKQSYSNVTFEITTNKGTYTIVSGDTPFDCETNDFVPININLSSQNASFVENETEVDPTAFSWTLVKDALAVDDLVVIAAAGSGAAMSVVQNTNNRGMVDVTKSGNTLTANADVQVFRVVSGSKSGTFALRCKNGDELGNYIAAVSSTKNNMHSNASVDDNASWDISIDDDGVADVVAQGSFEKNIIRYNSSDKLFSCYSTGQADIVFYRAGLPYAELSFPGASYTVNLGESFTTPELSNPYDVSVAYSSSNASVAAVDASSGAVTIVSAGSTVITASFAGNSTYSASEASYEIIVVDPNAERWVKTDIGSITASDVFVIVGGGYAVTNDNGTSGAPAAKAVSITGDALTDIPASNLQWKVTGSSSDGYSFSPAGNATSFLYCNTNADSGSNNNIRVGTGDRKVWEFDDNGYMKTKDAKAARYFSKYNDQDWRGYVNTSNGAIKLEFYVKQGGSSTPVKTLSSISVTPPTKTTYTVGEAFDATGMVVTATYSDATTADVTSSATNDFTTQVASAGNKTVTVSYTEEGVTKTDTFAITVSAATGSSTVTFTPGTDTGETSITKDGITVTMTTMNNDSYYQVYANQTMVVSSNTHTITGISFTCTASGTSKYGPGNASANVGNYSYSGSNGVWSGSASSVTISSTAQIRMTTLTITYE